MAATDGDPAPAQLAKYFFIDDKDRSEIASHRGAHNRLGYAIQLCTVRFLQPDRCPADCRQGSRIQGSGQAAAMADQKTEGDGGTPERESDISPSFKKTVGALVVICIEGLELRGLSIDQ